MSARNEGTELPGLAIGCQAVEYVDCCPEGDVDVTDAYAYVPLYNFSVSETRLLAVSPHASVPGEGLAALTEYARLPSASVPVYVVRWMEMGHVSFETARDIYRLLSALLLFYALYRYARLYTSFLGGILAMLLVSVVYPVSFEHYAGQLTDPLSHLSFVLGFIFLETENFPLLLATVLIGSLAKETVLAISGYYALFCRGQRGYPVRAFVLGAGALFAFLAVRTWVLHGPMRYQQVAGVDTEHITANWRDGNWPALFLITACSYLPFLVLCWKSTPSSLKRMYLYLLPVLFISSLIFSWLVETRNFMPAVFVLCVATARCFVQRVELAPGCEPA